MKRLSLQWTLVQLLDKDLGTGIVVSRHKSRELAQRAAARIKEPTKVAAVGAVRIGPTLPVWKGVTHAR